MAGDLLFTKNMFGQAAPSSVGTGDLQDGAVVTSKLADKAVTSAKMAKPAVFATNLDAYLPRGKLGRAYSTSTQTGITTEVDVTGCSVTVTTETDGRALKITGRVNTGGASAADTKVYVLIKQGTTEIGRLTAMHSGTGGEVSLYGAAYIDGVAALAYTYKLTIQTAGGSVNTASLSGSSRNFILVEDCGV